MVRVSSGGPAYTEHHSRVTSGSPCFGFAGGIGMAVSVKKITLWRVEVDNAPGALAGKLERLAQLGADLRVVMGYQMATSIGEAGINMSFVMAQVIGGRYSAVFGFENAADVSRATGLIKKAATAKAQQRRAVT